jgi:hypothetical protein
MAFKRSTGAKTRQRRIALKRELGSMVGGGPNPRQTKTPKRVPRPYKRAGTKPKARHPGRAYPKPKGRLIPKGRGRRTPDLQHGDNARRRSTGATFGRHP